MSLLLLAAASVAPAGSIGLSEAGGFNLLVWGNATLLNSDTEGSVAVGGNASFNSYSIGTQSPAANSSTGVFVVGGNLTANNGQVSRGSVYVGGTYSGPGYNLTSAPGSGVSSGLGAGGLPFDFSSAQSALSGKSTAYAGFAANGLAQMDFSTLTLTGTDTGLNVFNITASQLASASGLAINAAPGSHVLINVSGSVADFSSKGIWGTFDRTQTLFNFYQATSLEMKNIGIEGSILAPFADVKFWSGQMNGQLIANSFRGETWGVGEMHQHPFVDQPSSHPPQSVPDSGSTAWLALLTLVGLVAARRWQVGRR
ncbi:MAG TPA: VPDSG-CTERM sorting domain-containing protein [Opitutaceae bacterium]|nr:VPDSG-CTERM sorting domain-containing protein [Opitutaceae bacterium]